MSILDANFAEDIDESNVPISIELLHQEGWMFSLPVSRKDEEWSYPDINSWPIHGGDPWNPYWLVNKDARLGRIKLLFGHDPVQNAIKWDDRLWCITRQPKQVMFEIGEQQYYANTWKGLNELTTIRLYEYQSKQILSRYR